MVKVALHGVKFLAYHGFYPQERIMGNHFIVDAEVEFLQLHQFTDDEIAHTVNYEQVYAIVDKHMRITRKLLETVVQSIIDDLKTTYPFAETIRVGLKKLNPPLPGSVACSFIEITYHKPDDF
jgi:dihydroneopterin aldolase